MRVIVRQQSIMSACMEGALANRFLESMLPNLINVPSKDPSKHTCYRPKKDMVFGKRGDLLVYLWDDTAITVEH